MKFLVFRLNHEQTGYIVTECSKSTSGELEIPSTYSGLPVTSIGELAFYYCKSLTSITIPDSVTSIGYSAFEGCTGLTSITIPDSVTSIGKRVFEKCSNLEQVTIRKLDGTEDVYAVPDEEFMYTLLNSLVVL